MSHRILLIISTDEWLAKVAPLIPIIEHAGLAIESVISYAWYAWKTDNTAPMWWMDYPYSASETISELIYEDLDDLGVLNNRWINSGEVVQVALSIGVSLYYQFETDLTHMLSGYDLSRLELEDIRHRDMILSYR